MQNTMALRQLSISIKRNVREAYAFLSQPKNFTLWASGLGTLKQTVDGWTADTQTGMVSIRFSEQNAFGVLDHWVTLSTGAVIYVPLRIIENGTGCELILTLFRLPEMTQEQFELDAQWVLRDLQAAKRHLEKE